MRPGREVGNRERDEVRAAQPNADAWTARPWWARLVCLVTVLAPVAAGATAAIELSALLPRSSSLAGTVLRVLFVVASSTVVVFGVDRVARRLLPLAALYRLSLVFPDRAPSRFRTALKAGSSRRVERLVAETARNGLPADAGEAARQVVELITAIGDHDRRTRGHSERVRLYADLIGEELHLSQPERQKLQWAALLHDLGKLTVPAEILNKNGAPTAAEWDILRTHPSAGERLVAPLRPFLGTWADAVGGHHEWWNGTGYPRQLKGEQISQSAAIVAVADAYEVMTAVRSYKKSMPASAARGELAKGAGGQFSPPVVRAFLCVSLGKLRLAAGPAASLAQIPYLGNAVRFPASVGTALQGASSVAAGAAPSVAASVMIATTAVATSMAAAPPAHRAHTLSAQVQTIAQTADGTTPTTAGGGAAGESGVQSGGAGAAATTKGANGAASKATNASGSGAAPADAHTGTAVTPGDGTDVAAPEIEDPATTPSTDAAPDSDSTASNPVSNDPTSVTPVNSVVVPPVRIAIGDDATPEGDTGWRTMTFPVTLSRPAAAAVAVQYAVTGVTATGGTKADPGVDFRLKSGTLTFTPAASGGTAVEKIITVAIRGDTTVEPDETLNVTLSDPTANAVIVRGVATGTILNDDGITAGITSGIGDASIATDVAAKPISLTVPVWLSAPAASDVSISYTIEDGTATWCKPGGTGDYGGTTSGTLTFAAGTVGQKIQIRIWPRSRPEPARQFTIVLSSSDPDTTLIRAIGTATIYGA